MSKVSDLAETPFPEHTEKGGPGARNFTPPHSYFRVRFPRHRNWAVSDFRSVACATETRAAELRRIHFGGWSRGDVGRGSFGSARAAAAPS